MPTSLLNTTRSHDDAIFQDRPMTGHQPSGRQETPFRYYTPGLHEPTPTTRMQRFSEQVWYFMESLRSAHLRYAFKTALALLAIITPAFLFDDFAAIFEDFRLDWALVTVK